jgi:hypothetical protein
MADFYQTDDVDIKIPFDFIFESSLAKTTPPLHRASAGHSPASQPAVLYGSLRQNPSGPCSRLQRLPAHCCYDSHSPLDQLAVFGISRPILPASIQFSQHGFSRDVSSVVKKQRATRH